jgi:hypothetical protein
MSADVYGSHKYQASLTNNLSLRMCQTPSVAQHEYVQTSQKTARGHTVPPTGRIGGIGGPVVGIRLGGEVDC